MKKNSPLGYRQGTIIAKKVLKLRSQRIAVAVVDIKNLSALGKLLTPYILVVMLVEML